MGGRHSRAGDRPLAGRVAGRSDDRPGGHHHGSLGDVRRARRGSIAENQFEGIDLLPILRGAAPAVERTLFWRVGPAAGQPRAVRNGDWKFIQEGLKQLLFDVTRDPGEREDLAARYPDRVRRLKAMLDAWEKDIAGASGGR